MLSSDTLPNPKNDGHYLAIVTRSGRLLDNANIVPKRIVSNKVDDAVKPSAPCHLWLMMRIMHV